MISDSELRVVTNMTRAKLRAITESIGQRMVPVIGRVCAAKTRYDCGCMDHCDDNGDVFPDKVHAFWEQIEAERLAVLTAHKILTGENWEGSKIE